MKNKTFVRDPDSGLIRSGGLFIASAQYEVLSRNLYQKQDEETLDELMQRVHRTEQRWTDFLHLDAVPFEAYGAAPFQPV